MVDPEIGELVAKEIPDEKKLNLLSIMSFKH